MSFRSASGQDPKAAKFAVLSPGHAGFPNRVKRSEGSDTTPIAICALNCSRQNGSNSLESLADHLLLKFESLNLLEMYNEH